MNLLELQSALKDLLKDGTPTNVTPILSHTLTDKFWRCVDTQRLFKVTEVHALTIILLEFYETNLYNNPQCEVEDNLSNRFAFERAINTNEIIEVIINESPEVINGTN